MSETDPDPGAASTPLPLRDSCRGLVVDPFGRLLLAQHQIDDGTVWVGPGGGVEAGETLLEALVRELHEETGLHLAAGAEPSLVWVQEHEYPEMAGSGWSGVRNHYFLIRTGAFEPVAGVAPGEPGHPFEEGVLDLRWWTPEELAAPAAGTLFSPRALPRLMADLRAGVPTEPLRLGL